MASVSLPPSLDRRLAALAARVRWVGALRGASLVLVVAILTAAAIVALDAAARPAGWARCGLQVGWLGLVAGLIIRLVVRPWQTEIPLAELAQRIEALSPGLGERLLTVVGLTTDDPGHGSPLLIAGLVRDTEARTREIDFRAVAPIRPAARLALGAVLVTLIATTAAALIPGTGEHLRRVGMPWPRPTGIVPFRVIVTSGDTVVRRGGPVTLSAYLEPTSPSTELPDSATLLFRAGPNEPEARLPMTGDPSAAFHVTRPHVSADFEYRIEAGRGASGWHTVRVADPVELTERSTIEITPPSYPGAGPVRTVTGMSLVDGLQYSTAILRFRFDRPAGPVTFDWRPEGRRDEGAEPVPIELAADRTGGTATFRLRDSGMLRLVLTAGPGQPPFRTETLIPVRVTVDAPPRFEQLAGVTLQPRMARPGDRVPVAVVAADDLGVAAAEIESTTTANPGQIARLPIALVGAGTPRAVGWAVLDLSGLGGQGETIRFRVRVTDTRRLSAPDLGPQEVVFPPEGWSELKISGSAPPLGDQDIIAQRDALRQSLQAARDEVGHSTNDARSVDVARIPFPVDQAERLRIARDHSARAAGVLHEAAQHAALTPDLRPLAVAIREVADYPLRDTTEALRRAASDTPEDRPATRATAVARLADALGRIDGLILRNDRLAQNRLDRRRLEALATDQAALAERLRPGPPPGDASQAQQFLHTRLAAALAESPSLKATTDAAAVQDARRLATDAAALATVLHELTTARREVMAGLRRARLQELVEAQTAAVERADGLLAQIKTALRVGGVSLPAVEAFRRPADLLAQDRPVDAMTELEKLAQALDRVATEFDRIAAERSDPKQTARQLANWQTDLHSRVAATDPAALLVEQQAILGALERLRLPPDEAIVKLRDDALTHLRLAIKHLEANDKPDEMAMIQTVGALIFLADKAPKLTDRLTRARGELDKLRTQQDEIIAESELVFRPFPPVPDGAARAAIGKRLGQIPERQAALVARLEGLDLPGLEARQSRTRDAIRAAAEALKEGWPLEVAAALAAAKRELERLWEAAGRLTPADARTDELARRQHDIVTRVERLGPMPTPKDLELLLVAQTELGQQLSSLTLALPEAPATLFEARDAARLIEVGLRDGLNPDELRRRAREARDALTRLANRVNGRETDRDRVKRLAEGRLRVAQGPANPWTGDAIGEEKRRLVREAEELQLIRVGGAGQAMKKRVLDLYAQLSRLEKARPVGEQKPLADALLALAEAMPAPMAVLVAPGLPGAPPEERYLPSKVLAEELREWARQTRAMREQVGKLPAEILAQARPGSTNPLADIEHRQRAISEALIELADSLFADQEPTAAEAGRAAGPARVAADQLLVGRVRAAHESTGSATRRLRELAASAGERPWRKVAEDLATRQAAIQSELECYLDDPAATAAQQDDLQKRLAVKAEALAVRAQQAAHDQPPEGPLEKPLASVAELTRVAATALTAAVAACARGEPAAAEEARVKAERTMQKAADVLNAAIGPVKEGSPAVETGTAIRQAELAMRRAREALGPEGDPATAERLARDAAAALSRAAVAVGPGHVRNRLGTPGLDEVPPELIRQWEGKYGQANATAIRHYFEQATGRR